MNGLLADFERMGVRKEISIMKENQRKELIENNYCARSDGLSLIP